MTPSSPSSLSPAIEVMDNNNDEGEEEEQRHDTHRESIQQQLVYSILHNDINDALTRFDSLGTASMSHSSSSNMSNHQPSMTLHDLEFDSDGGHIPPIHREYGGHHDSSSNSDREDLTLSSRGLPQQQHQHPLDLCIPSLPSSTDDEAPLSMTESSPDTVPSISPPLVEEEPHHHHHHQPSSTQPPQHNNNHNNPIHEQTRPKLARVASDPSAMPFSRHSDSSSNLPLGNRPGGVALPNTDPNNPHGHQQHAQGGQSQATHGQLPSSSFPFSASTSAAAGPSTSSSTRHRARYADPDSHWLSEDEGGTFHEDVRRNRHSPRRRGGPRLHARYPPPSSDGDGAAGKFGNGATGLLSGSDDDNGIKVHSRPSQEELFIDSAVPDQPPRPLAMPDSRERISPVRSSSDPAMGSANLTGRHNFAANATTTTSSSSEQRRRSPISNKPSAYKYVADPITTFKDYAPYIKDLTAVLPKMISALECPSCGNVMSDPTTLACGHSQCLLCVSPNAASVLLRKTSPTAAPIAITAAVLTIDEAPALENAGSQGDSETMADSHIPTIPKTPRAILADGVCAVNKCGKTTKALGNGRQGLRVDVVLQKIAALVKAYIAFGNGGEGSDSDGLKSAQMGHPSLRRESAPGTLLDLEGTEEEGSLSEPVYRRVIDTSVTLARSRSQLRSGEDNSGLSNSSSPDEETVAQDSSKRMMKSRRASAYRSSKKSRAVSSQEAVSGIAAKALLDLQNLPLTQLVTEVLSELECHICVTLMYEPLTTPCGHTFCKKCFLRSLDHSSRCPLCRSELPGMGFFVSSPINATLSTLMVNAFPMLYEQRRDLAKQEESDTGLDTAIFICMVSFPHMPTNLHIYEPKYRLMMRRCMDGNKRFGMVLPSRQAGSGGFATYGTMLEIRNIHMFDDGRSMVETVGVHRFKILESGTMDGYTVGRVERIDDIGDEEEAELERMALARSANRMANERDAAAAAATGGVPSEKLGGGHSTSNRTSPRMSGNNQAVPAPHAVPVSSRPSGLRSLSFSRNRSNSSSNNSSSSNRNAQAQSTDPAASMPNPNDASAADAVELTNAQLIDACKSFVEALRTGSTPWLLQRLNSSLPPMPDDPREFTWWMAMLMPVDDHEKARLLQITSYRLRLRLLVFWIQQMQHSWWFSRGCTIS